MKIAIIAGQGELPKILAQHSPDIFIICINGLSNLKDFKNPKTSLFITEVEKLLHVLKKNQIEGIILSGKFYRPEKIIDTFKEYSKDIINDLKYKGDNELLKVIKVFFETNGFKLLPPTILLKSSLFQSNEIIPKLNDINKLNHLKNSTKYASELLEKISNYDVGQAVVLSGRHVIGIEGLEGTNSLIKRCGKLYKKHLFNKNLFGPILVKFPKVNQTLELDMPVIGIETIKLCHEFKFLGIVVSKSGTLIINQKEIIDFCLNNKIYLYIFDV